MEHKEEAGQTKGEQALEVHDMPAACCQKRVVRKKIVSENRDSEEETTLEEHDDALVIEVSNVLVEELRKLIRLFSLEDVKKALAVAESDI
jgi:phosphoribosylaminoimidazole carboxylase (NCAIR synthetase)